MADEEREPSEPQEDGQEEGEESSDYPSLLQFLEHPEVVKDIAGLIRAITGAIEVWGKGQPERTALSYRAFRVSQFFALAIFVGIGLLGWLKVFSGETTAAMLSALIGYWYGQREKTK